MPSRELRVVIVGDASSLQKALGQSQSSLARTGQTMTRTGTQLTRSLTLPIVAAGAAATKYTYDFDQSMNHISALVGANTKEMDYYRESILKLAPAVGQGPKELADALYFVTSSGFKGAAAMKVLEASAKGAASGLGDTQTIADLVTSAINVYGEKNLSAARAVDVLTAAVKDGKGEPADYATAMGRVIPVAQNLGVSFDQVGAALAALTLGGFSADKATTGLTSIFTNLSKETTTGAAALKKVGLSYGGIRAEIKDKGLLPAMLDINKAFDGNGVALRKVFSSGKAIVPFLSLTGQAAKKNVGVFNDLANSTGASADAFKKQSQSDAFQVQQSLAKIQVAAVHAGGIILPVFADVSSSAAGVADAFASLPEGSQKLVVEAGLAVAALGPLLRIGGSLITVYGGVRTALLGTASAEAAAGARSGLLSKGLIGIAAANPEVAVVGLGLATAALAIHFANARSESNEVTRAFERQRAAIDDLVTATLAAKNSHLEYRQAQLDVKQTANAVTEAQRAETKATKEYGFGSKQARDAMLQLTQARIEHQQAMLRESAAGAQWRSEAGKQAHEMQTLKHGIDAARGAVKQQLEDFQRSGSVHGLHDYVQGLADSRDKLRNLATEAKQHGLPAIAALATKLADQNQAALTLAESSGILIGKMSTLRQRIKALPTRKDIYIYTHFADLHTSGNPGPSGGTHRNQSPHATSWTGTPYSFGGETRINERGPELLSAPDGSSALMVKLPRGTGVHRADDTARMLGAGGAHIHLEVHGTMDPMVVAIEATKKVIHGLGLRPADMRL